MIGPILYSLFESDEVNIEKKNQVKTKEISKEITKEPKKDHKNMTNTAANSKTDISTELIKQLRDQTGVSIMQCKKALTEANGDIAKAIVILRKISGDIALKKADRTFKAGTIQAYIHANGNVATMLELNCETDFVSNNEEFKALAKDIAMHITATNPKFIRKEDVKEADKAAAVAVFEAEVKGKPEAVRKSILDGKLNAYFSEMVLLDQPFIKNNEVTIQGLIDAANQKFGEKIAIGRYTRYKVLEG